MRLPDAKRAERKASEDNSVDGILGATIWQATLATLFPLFPAFPLQGRTELAIATALVHLCTCVVVLLCCCALVVL